jgi:predicted hotdog family 3-hydroxylacyl-ACP dehydratase
MTDWPLHRGDFEHMIPHAGAMCLLARVLRSDEQSIVCEADGHMDPANPLRNAVGLPVTAGVEYAAQAMALHAALQRDGGGPVQGGVIAVLSDVRWRADRLDDVAAPLRVEAKLLAGTSGGRQYEFSVGRAGDEPLICGTVTVAFSAHSS